MLRAAKPTCTNSSRHSVQRAKSTAAATSGFNRRVKPLGAPPLITQKRPSQRAINIRPWEGISSMPEAFAIVRGIERKYGKIRNFYLLRDYELSEIYQPYFWAEFEEEASIKNVPADPKSDATVIQIDVPTFDPRQPGGVGLADLYGLLEPKDRVTEVEKPWESVVSAMSTEGSGESQKSQNASGMRTISVKVERSGHVPLRPFKGTEKLHKRQMLEVGQSFALWGGFYTAPPPPAPASEDSNNPASTEKTEPKRSLPSMPYMQAAQAKWEPFLKRKGKEQASVTPEAENATQEDVSELFPPDAELSQEHTLEVQEGSQALLDPPSTVAPSVASNTQAQEVPASTVSTPKPIKPHTTRRMRILEQAREIARTPLPDSVKLPSPEDLKAKEELEVKAAEDKAQAQKTIRERLQSLMGGRWF